MVAGFQMSISGRFWVSTEGHRAMTAATISERRACRFTGVARATVRYPAMRDDTPLTEQLETLAMEKPRWGYRRLHWRLERDGVHVNHKRVQRVYRAAGLHVRRRRRKRVSRARVLAPDPDYAQRTVVDGLRV